MDNRSYEIDEDRYKFTGKERDFIGQFALAKRGYDYFGARYYDARVGRWGSIDSLLEKHFDYSPYNYVLDNPLMYIDQDGRQANPIQKFFSWALDNSIKMAGRKFGKKIGEESAGGGREAENTENPNEEFKRERREEINAIRDLDIPQVDLGTKEGLEIYRREKFLKEVKNSAWFKEASEKLRITPIDITNLRGAQGMSGSSHQAKAEKPLPADVNDIVESSNMLILVRGRFKDEEKGFEEPILKFLREIGPL